MMLKVFPNDDLGSIAHDCKKEQEKDIHMTPTTMMPSISMLALPEYGNVEIVYPCIPDPDGENEGGQASSSLAISTRWISAAKLLQSDLATLAQREGGE
ncbi:hypothetical protein GW17_00044863 [Ensete ventricosum]|nr:hypothetical protein GW17_00044863 [Ensete ventricosum]